MGTDLLQVVEHAAPDADTAEQPELVQPAPESPAPVAQVPTATVGGADDPEEAAADRMADHALARLSTMHAALPDGPAAAGPVRRSVVAGGGQEGGVLDHDTASRIAASPGRPMAEPVRRRMEGAFGRSFSSVRVHDGAEAADLSSSISARAFTTGNDVFLGAGVDTGTAAGERVLAHELAHVVQNRGGPAPIHRLFGRSKKKDKVEAPPSGGKVPDIVGEVDKNAPQQEKGGAKGKDKSKPKGDDAPGNEGLTEDSRKAFTVAKRFNNVTYAGLEDQVKAWVTQKQQKEIVDISSYSKRAGGDEDKRKLKDLLRAFVLGQYVEIVAQKIAQPTVTSTFEPRALSRDERKLMESRYFPKTLQNRDKWKGLIDRGPYAPETQTWLHDAGFARAIERTPDQRATDAGGPKIDVRSTFIGGELLGAPRRMHLFLVYTSSEGEQTYFRGGPGGGAGDDDDDLGYTEADIGPYDTESIDWDAAAPSVTVATGDKALQALDKLYSTAAKINAMQVPYVGSTFKANKGGLGGLEALVTGENCNATAWTLLEMAGLEKKKPGGLHPGWGHKLGALLSKDRVGGLDVPETDDPAKAAKVAGKPTDSAAVYHDRALTEKVVALPGGTDITLLREVGKARKIRFGPDGAIGYMHKDETVIPPKVGRMFWVAGPEGGINGIRTDDGDVGYADCTHPIEVLEDDWIPGQEGYVKVRYKDPYGNVFEGKMNSDFVTDVEPAKKPTTTSTGAPKGESPGVAKDGEKDEAPRKKSATEELEELLDMLAPDAKRPVVGEFETDRALALLDQTGKPHKLGTAPALEGRRVGATGSRLDLPDGMILVEVVVDGEQAWITESDWDRAFRRDYPLAGR